MHTMGLRVVFRVVMLGLLGAVAVTKADCPRPYVEGSNWIAPNNVICHCRDNFPVCISRVGHCDGWGDVHYHSFDRKRFDFQGLCRYILSRACCTDAFTIEVEQAAWSATTSVSDKFTIRVADRIILLSKPATTWYYNGIGWNSALPYDDSEIRIEMIGAYVFVSLKQAKVWFRWNFVYHFDVWADDRYKGELCGLCGDFNGNPSNDLTLTPFNEPVSTIPEWGETWRVALHHQPDRCRCDAREKRSSVPGADDCCEHKDIMQECDDVINGVIFANCREDINPAPFIEDCHVEMCECAKEARDDCLCTGVSGYLKACRAAGFIIDTSWTADHNCGECRDKHSGIVYQHGQSWTYKCETRTCTNGKISAVMFDCCVFRGHAYPEGAVWTTECDRRQCKNGKIIVVAILKICGCYHAATNTVYENNAQWKCNDLKGGCCRCILGTIAPCFILEEPAPIDKQK